MKRKADILQTELPNRAVIYLHKEDLFLRAHEYSAYYFHKYIQPRYDLHKRFYRVVNQDIVYLGFPSNVLARLLQGLDFVEVAMESTDELIILRLRKPSILKDDLVAFKKDIPYSEVRTNRKKTRLDRLQAEVSALMPTPEACSFEELAEKIRSFDLDRSTALEAVEFIRMLKGML